MVITRSISFTVLGCFLVFSGDRPLSPVEARKKVGETITVEMTVQTTKDRLEKRGEIYLDAELDFRDEKNFAVVITKAGAAKLKEAGIDDPAAHFKDKKIRATGMVKEVDNVPRIEIDDAKQIRVVDTPAPPKGKPTVIEIWPGKVPEEPGTIGPEKIVMSPKLTRKEVEVTESTRMITNVTKPTLTIYRPAKDKDTGTAMVICPGGGYWNLYWELEGEEVAAWLNSLGITGIILKYRVPRRPDDVKGEPARRPLQDAQRAISLVRSRAKEWGIDPNKIGMVGFSAGGHLAIATATSFDKRTYEAVDEIDKIGCRPDFAILAYSGYLKAKDKDELAPGLRIPAGTPPVFLVHGNDDLISPPEHSVVMYLALKRAGIPAELHIYANTAHDFAVRPTDRPCSTWTRSCEQWLRQQGFLKGQIGS